MHVNGNATYRAVPLYMHKLNMAKRSETLYIKG